MAEATLATITVPQKKGKPRSRPRQLIADKGYDSRRFRQSLHARGIRPCIPSKRRPTNWKPRQGRPVKAYTEEYRQRWPVEPGARWADSPGLDINGACSCGTSIKRRTSTPSTPSPASALRSSPCCGERCYTGVRDSTIIITCGASCPSAARASQLEGGRPSHRLSGIYLLLAWRT